MALEQQEREHRRSRIQRVLKRRPTVVVALVVLALTLLFASVAVVICESNYLDCENERHTRQSTRPYAHVPEVALSPILLPGAQPPQQQKQNSGAAEAAKQQCPLACKAVVRTFADPIPLFTALLIFLVALQLTWMVRQEDILRESVEIAGNAANAARQSADSLMTVERAHIFVFPHGFVRDITQTRPVTQITMHALNYGKTPATLTGLAWTIRPFTGEPWVMPEDFAQRHAIRKIIAPSNEPTPLLLYEYNLGEIETLEFFGRAYFADIFGDEWSAAWAYRVEPTLGWVAYPLEHHSGMRLEAKT
jgi:hypothetical protein